MHLSAEKLHQLKEKAEASPVLLPQYVHALLAFADELSGAGLRDQAVSRSAEAVAVCRRIESGPGLATALSNHARFLSGAGRHTEALDAASDALIVARRSGPGYEPLLAAALDGLSLRLSKLGRHREAIAPAREAVALHRAMAAADPTARPRLAQALISFGTALAGLDLRGELLPVVEEAVAVWRSLPPDQMDRHRADYAIALTNLGFALGQTGSVEPAAELAREALAIQRELPDEGPNLAKTLNDLAGYLAAQDRWTEVLSLAEEAVRVRRGLVALSPMAFRYDLAASLCNLANTLVHLDRAAEGMPYVQEAVALLRELAADEPHAWQGELGKVLLQQASVESSLDRTGPALSLTTQATGILEEAGDDQFLAYALREYARVRAYARADLPAALAAIDRSIAIYADLYARFPAGYTELFGNAFQVKIRTLRAMGREADADALIRQILAGRIA